MQFQNGFFKSVGISDEVFVSLFISIKYLELYLCVVDYNYIEVQITGVRYLFSLCPYITIIICIIFIRCIFMPITVKNCLQVYFLKIVLLLSVKILDVIEYIAQKTPFAWNVFEHKSKCILRNKYIKFISLWIHLYMESDIVI